MLFGAYSTAEENKGFDFGCLTAGFSDSGSGIRTAELPCECRVCSGTYEEAEEFARKNADGASAAIVMTDGAGGENEYVRRLSEILSCPVVGGGAARPEGHPGDGLFGGKGQTDLCLLYTERSVHAVTKNIHSHVIGECTLTLEGRRILKTINGADAASFLKEKKAELGFSKKDFEHLTLSTPDGVNAHMREENGIIYSGRDLEEKMLLRYVRPEEVQEQMEGFYREKENALVFGCAGLKGILPSGFKCDSCGLFLYGEVCVTEKGSDFGNLMLCRLIFE